MSRSNEFSVRGRTKLYQAGYRANQNRPKYMNSPLGGHRSKLPLLSGPYRITILYVKPILCVVQRRIKIEAADVTMGIIPGPLERILELLVELRAKPETAKDRAIMEEIRRLSAEFEAQEARKPKEPT